MVLIKRKIKNNIFNLSGQGNIKIQDIIQKYNFKPSYSDVLKLVNYNINTKKINKIIKTKKSEKYLYDFLDKNVQIS